MSYLNILYSSYPQIVRTDGDIAYDINDNVVEYDKAAIQAQIDAVAYIEKRQREYPPFTDLADALYHQSKGDETKLTAYLAKCEAVKQKYPKE